MTQRRPHWDDELITAVCAAVANDHFYFTTDQVYDIIAAVEDWQARRLGASAEQLNRIADWQWMKVSIPLWHWAQAEAAIQRVQEIERRERCTSRDDEHYNDGWNDALAAVERALDGVS